MISDKPLGINNYGSIPHLLGSKLGGTDKYIHVGQHKILTEKTRDKNDFIIVTEKYDGSNVGIAKLNGKIIAITRSGYLAETSKYNQHILFGEWVEKNKVRFSEIINEGERLCGEWLLQSHSIIYKIKGDPFVAFDFMNTANKRVPFDELLEITKQADIKTPRILFSGYSAFGIESVMEKLNSSKYNQDITTDENPEGAVWKLERKGVYEFMAKYVRPDYESGKNIIGIDEDNVIFNEITS
jgi:ATP-dependent RNA circularization protein (DNA/RNA ligase family)